MSNVFIAERIQSQMFSSANCHVLQVTISPNDLRTDISITFVPPWPGIIPDAVAPPIVAPSIASVAPPPTPSIASPTFLGFVAGYAHDLHQEAAAIQRDMTGPPAATSCQLTTADCLVPNILLPDDRRVHTVPI